MKLWRRNLYVVWVTTVLTIASFSFIFPFLPLFVRELGVEDPGQAAFWTGVTGSAMGVALVFSSPFWGMVGDRYGRKKNMLRALFGSAIVLALTGLSGNVYHLVLFRFLNGLVSGVHTTSMALVASQTPRERMGFSMGFLQMGLFTGTTVGPLVGGVLADAVGFRNAFFISGGTLALAGTAVLLLVREEFQRPQELVSARPGVYIRSFLTLVTSREVIGVLSVLFLVQITPVMMFPVLPLFIGELAPQTAAASATGVAFGLMGLSAAIASLVVARISHRVGLKNILTTSAFLAGLLYMPMLLVQNAPQTIALVALFGLFNGGMMSTMGALMGVAVPREKHGRAFGALQSVHSMAFGLGPLIGGSLARVVELREVFAVNGLAFIVVGLLALKLVSVRERGAVPGELARTGSGPGPKAQ